MRFQNKVSVIIVHRDNKCSLKEAISSVGGQTLDNVEIIVVSSDDVKIKVDNVKLIYSKNSTYGELVNLGIERASGEYVAILDSDDFIDSSILSNLYNLATKYNADVVRCNYSFRYDSLTQENPFYKESMGGVWCEQMDRLVQENDVRFWPFEHGNCNKQLRPIDAAWLTWEIAPRINGIYSRKFLLDNKIKSSKSDDAHNCGVGLYIKSVLSAQSVVLSTEYGWHYRMSKGNDKKALFEIAQEFSSIDDFINTNTNTIKQRDFIATTNVARLKCYLNSLQRLDGKLQRDFLLAMSQEFRRLRDEFKINWYCLDDTDTQIINEIIDNVSMAQRRLDARNKAKISVIVPFYNVGKYIDKCLDSIVNQTMKDLEIILVDDESPDDSIITALKYWKRDPRITILYEKNKGLSGARNTGLWHARAPYVCFVDSDDYLEYNAYELMYDKLTESGADLVVGHIEHDWLADYTSMRGERLASLLRYSGLQNTNSDTIDTNIVVWNKLFRRSIINRYNIHCPEGMQNEDIYFTLAYMMLSKTIYFIRDSVYHYVHRPGSITSYSRGKKYDHKGLDNFRATSALFNDYVRKYNLLPKFKGFIVGSIIFRYGVSLDAAGPSAVRELSRMAKGFLRKHHGYFDSVDKTLVYRMRREFKRINYYNLYAVPHRSKFMMFNPFSLALRVMRRIMIKL